MWKFPGQEPNPRHSSDLSCWDDTARTMQKCIQMGIMYVSNKRRCHIRHKWSPSTGVHLCEISRRDETIETECRFVVTAAAAGG